MAPAPFSCMAKSPGHLRRTPEAQGQLKPHGRLGPCPAHSHPPSFFSPGGGRQFRGAVGGHGPHPHQTLPSFPRAALTRYHKLSSSNDKNNCLIVLVARSPRSRNQQVGTSESGEGGSLSGPLPTSSSFRHSGLVDGIFPVSSGHLPSMDVHL